MQDFAGRVAAITGAGAGMGRAHALLLAERGAAIVVQDIVADAAQATAEQVRAAGGTAHVAVCDVADRAAIMHALQAAERALGSIDVLVNNAGIGGEPTLEETTEADFDRTFAVHVKGSFFATQAVVPGMKQRRRGKIVNISSIWGMVGHHYASPYCGAKAALLGLTKAWARELAPWNIHVNAVAPGGVLTEMVLGQPDIEKRMAGKVARVPLGRYAESREISYAVAFLASSAADFITGQVLSPNGGEVIVGI
ncbi:MAG TPA: SDR family NAD(P)-dependent oxidoreductase [Acetobacteraceae bacterium]